MTPSIHSISKDPGVDERSHEEHAQIDVERDDNTEFGGDEGRKKLEKKLLWKLDLRMSILIIIYILNYVRNVNTLSSPLLMYLY